MGNHYLVRFQDRLVWCLVLERGASYCTLSIKGLELQETSCHTAEAARIDEQFEEAFERKSKGLSNMGINHYPLHFLTPLDAVLIRTYSDARNILTGVIDSPDSVGTTLSFFAKSLVWLLLHRINKMKKVEEEKKKAKEKEIAQMEKENELAAMEAGDNRGKKFIKDSGGGGGKRRDKVSVVSMNSSMKEINHNITAPNTHSKDNLNRGESFVLPPINGNRTNLVHSSRPPSRDSNSSRKVSLSSSLNSFTDSIWSDDYDPEKSKKKVGSTKRPPQKVSTVVSITNKSTNRPHSPHSVLTSLPPLKVPGKPDSSLEGADSGKEIDEFLGELDFGLPAVDINVPHRQPNVEFSEVPRTLSKVGGGRTGLFDSKPSSKLLVSNTNHIYKPVMNLAGSPDFKCPFSSHMR